MRAIVFLLCLTTGLSQALTIEQIQGSTTQSPVVGQSVQTTGVVTGVYPALDGFFIESLDNDQDPRTSRGLFVYQPRQDFSVSVGEHLALAGRVNEYNGQTQLTQPRLEARLSPASLPAPVTLPPYHQAEQVESMRTILADGEVVDVYQLYRYGSVELANGYHLDDGRFDTYPELAAWQKQVRAGQSVELSQAIVVDRFDAYRLFASQPQLSGNPRPPVPARAPEQIRIVSINLQNYFNGPFADSRGAQNRAQWQRQRQQTAQALAALDADIIAVAEIENDFDQRAPAIETLATDLGLQSLMLDQPVGSDAIAVALLYNPRRVQPAGPPNLLETIGGGNRVPILQSFGLSSEHIIHVAVQHWKSKRCSGTDCGEQARLQASQGNIDWLELLDNVLLLGDFNSYRGEPGWQALVDAGFQPLLAADAYTYRYRGKPGALDHAFAYRWQLPMPDTQVWHINADEAPRRSERLPADLGSTRRFSDHDPIVLDLTLP